MGPETACARPLWLPSWRTPRRRKQELAERSGVSEKTILRFEKGETLTYPSTLLKLRSAFESAGICFQFEGAAAKGIRIP